jgi:hypothetical protein
LFVLDLREVENKRDHNMVFSMLMQTRSALPHVVADRH